MNVLINGRPSTLPDGISVADLLELNELADRPCAVEINRDIVPKGEHPSRRIEDGDRIELVTLVGGG